MNLICANFIEINRSITKPGAKIYQLMIILATSSQCMLAWVTSEAQLVSYKNVLILADIRKRISYILWYTFSMFNVTVAISKYGTIFNMIVCDATCVMSVYRLYFMCVSARYNDILRFDYLKTIVIIRYFNCKDRCIATQQYLTRFVVICWWILLQKLILVMKSLTYFL